MRGKPIVDLLAPADDDYFVLKPKHSGFFSTALSVLLRYLGVHTLILTGMAGNICILFTANDAYMRDFRLLVPPTAWLRRRPTTIGARSRPCGTCSEPTSGPRPG